MITSARSSVRILDLYFDEPLPKCVDADLVRFNQFSRVPEAVPYMTVHTMLLDLSRTPDEIFSKFASHTRYKIRRAEKDNITHTFCDGKDPRQLQKFADFYDRHAKLKHLGRVSRKRLAILAEQNALYLSFVADEAGVLLVANSFFRTPSRVRGLHLAVGFRECSDPSRRALIGRANRYARWRDILRFHKDGVKVLDFGGWYAGKTDQEQLRVNTFKEEFAGTVVRESSWQKGLTWKGRIVLALMRRESMLRARSISAVNPLERAG